MCGIVGLLSNNKEHHEKFRSEIPEFNNIYHRGPDESGYHHTQSYSCFQNRLKIIDLMGGKQPIYNENRKIIVTFNGEIFNYIELREYLRTRGHLFYTDTDTEVIVHAYEEYGYRCFEEFNGQFAIAIWDTEKKELIMARDRSGICPLHYTFIDPGSLLYASEIKAIFQMPGIPKSLDTEAINQIFTCWSTIPPRTAFSNIYELLPGHYMTVKNGRSKITKYWSFETPQFNGFDALDHKPYIQNIRDLLYDSIKIRMRADVPVGAYVSGGIDSSVTALLMKQMYDNKLNTFSLRFEDQAFDERRYQEEILSYLHTDNNNITVSYRDISDVFPKVIWHTEKPILRTSPAPMFLLSRLVRKNGIKVVITGEGADEIFGGYNIFKEDKIRRFWAKAPHSTKRPQLLLKLYPYIFENNRRTGSFWINSFGKNLKDTDNPYYSHLIRWENGNYVKKYLNSDLISDKFFDEAGMYIVNNGFMQSNSLFRAQQIEYQLFMSGYLLSSQGDRMLMANSVEGRYPFLDHRLIEYAALIPPVLKIRGLNEKYILKRAFRNELPRSVIRRPKQPYRAPIARCFIGADANSLYAELLSENILKKYGYFDPHRVNRLITKIKRRNDLQTSERDSMALVGIISTQLLHSLFIAQDGLVKPTV